MSKNASEQPDDDKNITKHKRNSFHIDWFQFTIALIIIVSFTLFLGKVVWDSTEFEDSFKIISIVAPFVGTIIGFYFGQKPVQNLTKEVAEVTIDKHEATRTLRDSDRLNMLNEQIISKLEADLLEKEEFIENLKSRYEV